MGVVCDVTCDDDGKDEELLWFVVIRNQVNERDWGTLDGESEMQESRVSCFWMR